MSGAGLFVPVYVGLSRHRKVLRAASLLGCSRFTVVGHLAELWAWGLENAKADGLIPGADLAEIGTAAGWTSAPERFGDVTVTVGFVDHVRGGLALHNWRAYGGRLAAAREANALRQKSFRDRRRNVPVTVTSRLDNALEEKTREENRTTPPTPSKGVRATAHRRTVTLEGFAEWYATYPRHEARAKAEQIWQKLTEAERTECIAGSPARVAAYAGVEARYIPLPATYLHGRRWRDELNARPSARRASSTVSRIPVGPMTERAVDLFDVDQAGVRRHVRVFFDPDGCELRRRWGDPAGVAEDQGEVVRG